MGPGRLWSTMRPRTRRRCCERPVRAGGRCWCAGCWSGAVGSSERQLAPLRAYRAGDRGGTVHRRRPDRLLRPYESFDGATAAPPGPQLWWQWRRRYLKADWGCRWCVGGAAGEGTMHTIMLCINLGKLVNNVRIVLILLVPLSRSLYFKLVESRSLFFPAHLTDTTRARTHARTYTRAGTHARTHAHSHTHERDCTRIRPGPAGPARVQPGGPEGSAAPCCPSRPACSQRVT